MKRFILQGAIIHPGFVEVEAKTHLEAVKKANKGEFIVYDEEGRNLSFIWCNDIDTTEIIDDLKEEGDL